MTFAKHHYAIKEQIQNKKVLYPLEGLNKPAKGGWKKVDLISAKETQDWQNVIVVTYWVNRHTYSHTQPPPHTHTIFRKHRQLFCFWMLSELKWKNWKDKNKGSGCAACLCTRYALLETENIFHTWSTTLRRDTSYYVIYTDHTCVKDVLWYWGQQKGTE